MIPATPRNVRFSSAGSLPSRRATPRVRKPWADSPVMVSWMLARRSSVSGSATPPRSSVVHSSSRMSGAPFAYRRSAVVTDIIFRSEENGFSLTRSSLPGVFSATSAPNLGRATRKAASVGSPTISQVPSSARSSWALLATAPAITAWQASSRATSLVVSVTVPVGS